MNDILTYIIILFISFFGIIAGAILALIAPEELEGGKKYWDFLQYILIFLTIIVVYYYSSQFVKVKYLIVIFNILNLTILTGLKFINREYPAFSFLLFFAFLTNKNFLFLIASLIFFYGMIKGTLGSTAFLIPKLNKYRKINYKKIKIKNIVIHLLKENILFIIFGIILLPLIAYIK